MKRKSIVLGALGLAIIAVALVLWPKASSREQIAIVTTLSHPALSRTGGC